MCGTWEQLEFIPLWKKHSSGFSPVDYIHGFITLFYPDVAENLMRNIEEQWNNLPVESTENERYEIINTFIVSSLID